MSNERRASVTIRKFATPEEVYALEFFRPLNPLTKDTFAEFFGHYDFLTDVKCCFLNPSGNLCGEEHMHGWVAKLKDGTTTLLGGTCATNKFDADERIRKAVSIYKNEARRQEKLGRLSQMLNEKAERVAQLQDVLNKLSAMRIRVEGFTDALGEGTLQRLRNLARIGRAPVSVDMVTFRPYIDEDGEMKKERRSTPTVLGVLNGLSVVSSDTYRTMQAEVANVLRAIRQAEAIQESNPKTALVDTLVAQIDSSTSIASRFVELVRTEQMFWQNDWSLIWLLTPDRTEQKKSAKLHLQRTGQPCGLDAAKAWIVEQERRYKVAHRADQLVIR